jgi:hypothetical protein
MTGTEQRRLLAEMIAFPVEEMDDIAIFHALDAISLEAAGDRFLERLIMMLEQGGFVRKVPDRKKEIEKVKQEYHARKRTRA